MIRSIILGAGLAFSLTTIASAGIMPTPPGNATSLVVKVAEECGAGRWRGPDGRCHPFAVNRACPAGYHIGPDGKKCWPN